MSEKKKVVERYQEAIAHSWADRWCIYSKPFAGEVLGEGRSARAAWQNAYDNHVRFNKNETKKTSHR